MDTPRKLKPEEAEKIHAALFPLANYLIRLRGRMVEVSFHPSDPIFVQVVKAQDDIQGLMSLIHYASCMSGVGKPQA